MFGGLVVARVLDDALTDTEGEIEPGMRGVALLELLDDAEGMQVVVEAQAVFAHGRVERALACVAERRMADIVDQREGLAKVFVEVERLCDRAGDLRDLESVRQPAAEMVGRTVGKDLGLARHAPEGAGVGDASAIALERGAIGVNIFGVGAGGERVLAVAPAHRAGGEIELTQFETGYGAGHAFSLTRSTNDSGLDVAVRLLGRHEDFVRIVLAKGR